MSAQPTATIKNTADDFKVSEVLARPLSGVGQHAYFYVEKRQLNTWDAVQLIAQRFRVPARDIGFAGRKDKQAVTRQWFSVPVGDAESGIVPWDVEHAQLRCLSQTRHSQKLRRGQLQANLFDLRVILEQGEPLALAQLNQPFPNRFGTQRFGKDNLQTALDWLAHRRSRRVPKHISGWYLSVLRSFLFNEVINLRDSEGGFEPLPGDVLNNGVPTAPLWGRGRSETSGRALELEQAALAPHQEICEALEYAGVVQGRRVMTVKPGWMAAQYTTAGCLSMTFSLPAGSYATALLDAKFTVVDGSAKRGCVDG